MRDTLDKIIMQSKNYNEVLERLQCLGCEVKCGKYLSVRPQYATNFIRTKSLGVDYTEQAIKNRLVMKQRFESDVDNKINSTKPDTLEFYTQKTIRHYTVVFAAGVLPVRKKNNRKVFSWTNDAELDRLADLNQRINLGMTLQSLRNDFATLEKSVADKEGLIERINSDTTLPDRLYKAGYNFFNYGSATDSERELLRNFKITVDNYKQSADVVAAVVARIEKSLSGERDKLHDVSDTLALMEKVMGGTLVQSLVDEEKHRMQSEFLHNGIKSADGDNSKLVESVERKVTSGKRK